MFKNIDKSLEKNIHIIKLNNEAFSILGREKNIRYIHKREFFVRNALKM